MQIELHIKKDEYFIIEEFVKQHAGRIIETKCNDEMEISILFESSVDFDYFNDDYYKYRLERILCDSS